MDGAVPQKRQVQGHGLDVVADANKLAVLVHHNNEVTILDERGHPRVCAECRFSGWRNNYSRREGPDSMRCLHYSGGADPVDGDRILDSLDSSQYRWEPHGEFGKRYPYCKTKNLEGKCPDYVKAKPLPWWGNFLRKLFGREWKTRKMRL